MRRWLVRLHRWFGLFTALFLFIAGLTGAVIAWSHELDAWLNPTLFRAREQRTSGSALSGLALIERIERADPHAMVTYGPLQTEPGETARFYVAPRRDPTSGQAYALAYDQIALDPQSGAIQGRRLSSGLPISRENLMPFLYRLHYSLHLPKGNSVDAGVLFMGLVALVWTLDTLIAIWIAFPNRKVWLRSLRFRLRQGGHKLTFDLHRSGGVWTWLLLVPLAISAVSMNLHDQVVRPLVGLVSELTPSAYYADTAARAEAGSEALLGRDVLLTRARLRAAELGITKPPGALYLAPDRALFGVGFFAAGEQYGERGFAPPWLYFDARSGAYLGADVAGRGTAGDLFLAAQFPIHSGRILGVPGRVLVSLLGLLIATLSATGVLLWARRRYARGRVRTKVASEPRRERYARPALSGGD